MEIDYRPLIQTMTWSASRIKAFEQCPYGWFLHYILYPNAEKTAKFFTSYGSFIHKLLEEFYNGKITKEEMLIKFLSDFQKEVTGTRPKALTVNKYIESGVNYLSSFEPLPFEPVSIEMKLQFYVQDIPFVGVIDYLGKDGDGLVIVDHKSRELKPRSNRSKPTLKDKELDEVLKQLYLYSIPVKDKYGTYPTRLCLNCFRNRELIVEPFDETKLEEIKQWAVDRIHEIQGEKEFEPNQNFFFCPWICDVSYLCKYDLQARNERR